MSYTQVSTAYRVLFQSFIYYWLQKRTGVADVLVETDLQNVRSISTQRTHFDINF